MRSIEKLECKRECQVGDVLNYGEASIPANSGGECDLVYGLGDKSFVWLLENTFLSVVGSPGKNFTVKYEKGNPRDARRNATVYSMWDHDASNGYTDIYLYLVDKEMNKIGLSDLEKFSYRVESIPRPQPKHLNSFQRLVKFLGI